MEYKIERSEGRTALHLSGQLLESDRSAFEALFPKLVEFGASQIEIELSLLGYMDSIGLGLLVTLHGWAKRTGIPVVLKQPKGDVRELLISASIDRLMPII